MKEHWRVWAGVAVLAFVALVICYGVSSGMSRRACYAAHGTFYYWFHGLEMTSGRGDWGGPDPLMCFKEDLWDKRPKDFQWTVWYKFLRQRKRDEKQVRPIFKEAYNSVAASHTETAFTWGRLYASSSDPVVAADVVNAYMDSLAELELELLNKRKASSVESLALCYYRLVKRREKMESALLENGRRDTKEASPDDLALIKKQIKECEREINLQQHVDNRTNTMFKIMYVADVPKEPMGFRERKRMKEILRWFDGLKNCPEL